MSGDPAPMAVLEFLWCQCKRRCELPHCTCLSNGLQCTDLCRLQHCDNRYEDPVEAIAGTDDEDNDDYTYLHQEETCDKQDFCKADQISQ